MATNGFAFCPTCGSMQINRWSYGVAIHCKCDVCGRQWQEVAPKPREEAP